MLSTEPMTVLLVSDHAEEIKKITVGLRSFYPGCRVEAVYSQPEALEWVTKVDWQLVIVDEHVPPQPGLEILADLRRRARNAALIVLTETSEPSVAIQLMRSGADCALFRKSPSFLTELLILVRTVLEKRDLGVQRDLTQARYMRLIEVIDGLVYELDAEGRFVFVSEDVLRLLGYSPHELIGTHYSSLVPPAEHPLAEHRVNERRTGSRATRNLLLHLVPKQSAEAITVVLSAKGLYDRANEFIGSVGLARIEPLSREPLPPLTPEEQAPVPVRATLPSTAIGPGSIPAPVPSHERRRSSRIELPMEVRLTLAGTTWAGTVVSLNANGLYMELEGAVPSHTTQPVLLGFLSDVAVLHLRGKVVSVRELDRKRVGTRSFPATGLAVELVDPGRDDRMVFSSLLEGIREGSVSVSLTALLQPGEEDELLLEASAELAGSLPRVPLEPFPPEPQEGAPTERRLGTRVNFAIPVTVLLPGPRLSGRMLQGRILNLGLNGACLQLHTSEPVRSPRVEVQVTLPQDTAWISSGASPGTQAPWRVSAEVSWVLSEPASVAAATGSATPAHRVGVRFLHIDRAGEQRLRELVATLLTYPLRVQGLDSASRLLSSHLRCANQKGQQLAVYYDRPRKALPPGSPLAVIAPDFGETKRDYLFLAYALATNGFHVLRYDHTDHVGESQGEMSCSTLSGMRRDLSAMLRFSVHSWPASPLVVVAAGLAGRVALRAVTDHPNVRLLILLAGIFDVRAALKATHLEDVVGAYLKRPQPGPARGMINVLGFNVEAERWLGDLIQEDLVDLSSAIRDSQKIRTPTVLFAAEQDSRTPLPALKEVQSALGAHAKQTYLLPHTAHRLHDDPGKARALYRQVVEECMEQCYPAAPAKEEVRPPAMREICRQRLVESDRAFAFPHGTWVPTSDLLTGEVGASNGTRSFPDQWRYLEDLYRLLGRLEERRQILDAACGHGDIGAVLLINQAYRQLNNPQDAGRPPTYVALDSQAHLLARTRERLGRLSADLLETTAQATPLPFVQHRFSVADFRQPFPFKDGTFACVVCNLAISFSSDILSCVRELLRVMAPGGRLVLTSLRPHPDFPRLYRSTLVGRVGEDHAPEAKRLLYHWGTILDAEANGKLRFFDRQELSHLLKFGGAANIRVYPSLANLAYVAVGEKPPAHTASNDLPSRV